MTEIKNENCMYSIEISNFYIKNSKLINSMSLKGYDINNDNNFIPKLSNLNTKLDKNNNNISYIKKYS